MVFGLHCSPYLPAAVIDHNLQKTLGNLDTTNSGNFSRKSILKLQKGFYVGNAVVSVQNAQENDNLIFESRSIMASERRDSLVLSLKWDRSTNTLQINLDLLNNTHDIVTKRCSIRMGLRSCG